jgi:predicted nucleic acid-binding protein
MTILVDLNVILDVVQRREPHYTDSAVLLSKVVEETVEGAVPGHAITTIYYLVRSYVSRERAETTVDWLLDHMEVIPAGENDFRTARRLERWRISRMPSSLHWPIARPVT